MVLRTGLYMSVIKMSEHVYILLNFVIFYCSYIVYEI